ncbi:hypothetical protein ACWCP6_25000 [Streptomyces sp. NPDC002004]
MTAGWCSRTVRAAVFAAVCGLLAALGHVMMSGAPVPWWAMAVGAVATGAAAWGLAGRERGPLLVVTVVVAAQALLHSSFALAQTLAGPDPSDGASFAGQWARFLLCGAPSGSGTTAHAMSMSMPAMGHGTGVMHAVASTGASASMNTTEGMSPTGMLAAHLLAALLCGLWLAQGERAAFRILRALAGWLVAPLRLLLLLPTPPHRPRIRARRARSDRAPRRLPLVHTITSRGPPAAPAVV